MVRSKNFLKIKKHQKKTVALCWKVIIWQATEGPSTRIQIFFNPEIFLSRYCFRLHVFGESGIRIRNFLNLPSRVEIFNTLWIRNRFDTKSCFFLLLLLLFFFIRWRNKIEPYSSLPRILYSRWQPRSQVLSLTRLYDACPVANIPIGVLGTGMANSIWILTLVDAEFFESGKKTFQIQNYPDTCGLGLRNYHEFIWMNSTD